jgi:hypothetical protein
VEHRLPSTRGPSAGGRRPGHRRAPAAPSLAAGMGTHQPDRRLRLAAKQAGANWRFSAAATRLRRLGPIAGTPVYECRLSATISDRPGAPDPPRVCVLLQQGQDKRRERILAISAHPPKSPERRFPPGTFDKTCFLFKVSAPERRRKEDSGAFYDRSDRRNVKSDRAAAHRNDDKRLLKS